MDKLDRLYQLHWILDARRHPVATEVLLEQLECGRSTLMRYISDMKNYFNAPICNQRNHGYFYDRSIAFEMPGVWFNARELEALLLLQKTLVGIGSGLLRDQLGALRKRVSRNLAHLSPSIDDELVRIHVPTFGKRGGDIPCFSLIVSALLERKRMVLDYHSRSGNAKRQREVSPQRMLYYRNNWYLDGWCHVANGLRTFALERIVSAKRLETVARDIDSARMDRFLSGSYGIFGGEATEMAILVFTAQAASWVADEEWFPDQQGIRLDDGRYELSIPYGNPTELIMDICRYGAEVEVIGPKRLRKTVADVLGRAWQQYQ